MPEISRFFGIIIAMYYRDHSPPHFHVRYNEYYGSVTIDELVLLDGKLPKKVLELVIEWANKHRLELNKNWLLAERL